jgi:hypothetical protein
MSNPEGPIHLSGTEKVKAVPKTPVIQFTPAKDGLDNLKKVQTDLEEGSLDHAIILYRRDGDDYYLPLTDSTYETFGWMMQKTIVAMAVEDEGIEQE